jgi:hypothetical protein
MRCSQYNPQMLACLHEPRTPMFASQAWRLKGKPTTVPQVQHKLCDLVLDLVELYAEEESAKAAGHLSTMDIQSLLLRVDGFASQFSDTMFLLLALSPKSRDRKYGDLNSAIFHAWCLAFLLEVSLWVQSHLNRLRKGQIEPSSQRSQGLAPFIESQGDGWNDEMCKQTINALEFATGDGMGFYGAATTIFPMMMLQRLLPREHAASVDAAHLYGRLVAHKGVSNTLDYPLPKGAGAAGVGFWHRVDVVADPST